MIILIVRSVRLFLLALAVLALPFVFISFITLHEAPGSEDSVLNHINFLSLVIFTSLTFVSAYSVGNLLKIQKHKRALWIMLLPIIPLSIFALTLALTQILCDGKLACY